MRHGLPLDTRRHLPMSTNTRRHRSSSFDCARLRVVCRPFNNRKYNFLSLTLVSLVAVAAVWQLGILDGSGLLQQHPVIGATSPEGDKLPALRLQQQLLLMTSLTPASATSSTVRVASQYNGLLRQQTYVTLCPQRMYGYHRLGNHLFLLSAMLYAAQKTGRRVLMPAGPTSTNHGWTLDDVFDFRRPGATRGPDEESVTRRGNNDTGTGFDDADEVVIERFDASEPGGAERPCPCSELHPDSLFGGDRLFDTADGIEVLRRAEDRTLALCGLYQVFRYADAVGRNKLRRLLRFRPEVRSAADEFRRTTRPVGWPEGSYVRVGVHVRRGDFLNASPFEGLTVVDAGYLDRAIEHFLHGDRQRVQFVVATDDWKWTGDYFRSKFSDAKWIRTKLGTVESYATVSSVFNMDVGRDVSVAFADGESSAAVDFAVLADCDASVVSTGSFSWWGAWLANGTTVYYRRWPRDGSYLYAMIDRDAYFPPHWIPMV